jgi:peptide/nickel transport system permease protein
LAIDTFVAVDEILAPSRGAQLRARVFGHTTILIGAGVILFMLAVALLAPWLAPDDPFAQDLSQRLLPPVWHERGSWTHVLGTDQLGRDYLIPPP